MARVENGSPVDPAGFEIGKYAINFREWLSTDRRAHFPFSRARSRDRSLLDVQPCSEVAYYVGAHDLKHKIPTSFGR